MWEYRDEERDHLISVSVTVDKNEAAWGDNLNCYGRNGWELVTVIKIGDIYHHIFKRKQ